MEKKKGGRPPRYPGERLSPTRSFRVRPALDQKIQESSAAAGRSASEEIERRLEDSYFRDRLDEAFLGTDVGADILRTLRAVMVLEGVTPDWDGNPAKAERFRTVANAVIVAFLKLPTVDLPPPEKRQEDMRTAKELLLRFSPRHVVLPAEVMFSDLEELEQPARARKAPPDESKTGT